MYFHRVCLALLMLSTCCQSRFYFPTDQPCETNEQCLPVTRCPNRLRILRRQDWSEFCGWRQSEPLICCRNRSGPSSIGHSTRELLTYPVDDRPFHPSHYFRPSPPPFKRNLTFSDDWSPNRHSNRSRLPRISSISSTSRPDAERIVKTDPADQLKEIRRVCGTRQHLYGFAVAMVSFGSSVDEPTEWPWYASILINRPSLPAAMENDSSATNHLRSKHFTNLAIEIESYYAELSKNASQVQPKETRSRNEHHNYSESVLDQSPAVHHCGATLITDRFLLSAAHCFAGISFNNQPQQFANLRIGVGATRVNEMQKHQIARVHLHPKSNRSAHYNDIALIELRFPVKFNDLVRPICLPFVGHSSYDAKPAANSTHSDRGPLLARLSTNRRRVVTERAEQQDRPIESEAIENLAELTSLLLTTEGAQANIAGLGDTQFGGKRADVLQQARLVLINRQRCDAAYRRLNSSQLNDGINEQFLCASDRNVAARFLTNPRHIWRRRRQVDGESTGRMAADQEMADACQGDSGGPLITRLDSNTIKRNAFIASNLSASEISANQLQQLQQRLMKDQEQLIPHDLEGRIYLIGIVSLGRQCSDQEFPGVYVNVNYYKDWILSKLYGRL